MNKNKAKPGRKRDKLIEEDLEQRVRERPAELLKTIDQLNEEISRRRAVEEELRARSRQLSKMASQVTIAEEQERRRIMGILRDNVQQLLVGPKLRVAGLKRSPEKVNQAVVELEKILSQSIDVTRSLTSELSPPILHQSDFAHALEWLALWVKDRHGLEVDLRTCRDLDIESENTSILLFQAVRELLFNVVKHARTSFARVCVKVVRDQVRIQVSDDGVGFDPAQAQSQTDRFGLFSIREWLNSLGGRVQTETAPGKGCRITLLAPLHQPAEIAREWSDASGEPRAIRILVVDDHVIMRQGIAHLLKAQPDMDVVGEASDGQSAINMARQFLPDVIVMDMSMPIMSGPEATKIIHAEMPDIQVIGLSMFEEEAKAETMKQAGAVRYLTKTGPSNVLIATIRETARNARQRSITH
jgi:CheY-like chemotaxis protein